VVPPSSLKVYATGNGNADKDAVLAAVVLRYQGLVTVVNNDIADALIIAAIGARQIGAPLEASLPATHLRAMGGVTWVVT
jgi:crossover junction endodeoxyribonuclease RuvC